MVHPHLAPRLLLALFVSALLTSGCRSRAAAVSSPAAAPSPTPADEFDERIIAGSRRLKRAGAEFGKVLNLFLRNGEVDIALLRSEYDQVLQTVLGERTDLAELQPPNSPSARALYDLFDRYLQLQEATCREDMLQIVYVIEDGGLAFAEKQNAIMPILQAAMEKDQASLQSLNDARFTFATEHQLEWASRPE